MFNRFNTIPTRVKIEAIFIDGWELDDGNWLAMCQLEFDIAWKDLFTPYNCRSIINTMLSVKLDYMMPPKNEFYMKLINNLWPDVLDIPINPHKEIKRSVYSKLRLFARRRYYRILQYNKYKNL